MTPESIQVGLLFSSQPGKTASSRHIQHRGAPAKELLLVIILGGMIRDIFAQRDALSAADGSGITHRDPLPGQLASHLAARLRLQRMTHCRHQREPGMPRPLLHPQEAAGTLIPCVFQQQAGLRAARP
ncbi:hypothetical protein D3C73_922480 [compost metagenome]